MKIAKLKLIGGVIRSGFYDPVFEFIGVNTIASGLFGKVDTGKFSVDDFYFFDITIFQIGLEFNLTGIDGVG